jgi:hypothetical protein
MRIRGTLGIVQWPLGVRSPQVDNHCFIESTGMLVFCVHNLVEQPARMLRQANVCLFVCLFVCMLKL